METNRVAWLVLTLACGGSLEPAAVTPPACTPGQQVECACLAGAKGAQACKDDGTGYAACACPPGSTGTVGSSGGSTMSTGGAGGNRDSSIGGASGTIDAGGAVGSGGSPGTAGGATSGGCALCLNKCSTPIPVTSATISDFDGEAGLAVTSTEPHGPWAMDKDASPGGLGSFVAEPCGTTGIGLHFKGSGFLIWGAEVAATFISSTQPIDASEYSGVSFVLKSATPVSVIVILHNPDSQPAPACGNCLETVPSTLGSECYSGYLKIVSSDTTGTPQMLRWSDISRASWGYHFPNQFAIDPTQLIDIAFAVDQSVASFDLCIDDVKFFK